MSRIEQSEALIAHLYGELDPPEEEALLRAVREDPELAAELGELKRALVRYRGLPTRPPPASAARNALVAARFSVREHEGDAPADTAPAGDAAAETSVLPFPGAGSPEAPAPDSAEPDAPSAHGESEHGADYETAWIPQPGLETDAPVPGDPSSSTIFRGQAAGGRESDSDVLAHVPPGTPEKPSSDVLARQAPAGLTFRALSREEARGETSRDSAAGETSSAPDSSTTTRPPHTARWIYHPAVGAAAVVLIVVGLLALTPALLPQSDDATAPVTGGDAGRLSTESARHARSPGEPAERTDAVREGAGLAVQDEMTDDAAGRAQPVPPAAPRPAEEAFAYDLNGVGAGAVRGEERETFRLGRPIEEADADFAPAPPAPEPVRMSAASPAPERDGPVPRAGPETAETMEDPLAGIARLPEMPDAEPPARRQKKEEETAPAVTPTPAEPVRLVGGDALLPVGTEDGPRAHPDAAWMVGDLAMTPLETPPGETPIPELSQGIFEAVVPEVLPEAGTVLEDVPESGEAGPADAMAEPARLAEASPEVASPEPEEPDPGPGADGPPELPVEPATLAEADDGEDAPGPDVAPDGPAESVTESAPESDTVLAWNEDGEAAAGAKTTLSDDLAEGGGERMSAPPGASAPATDRPPPAPPVTVLARSTASPAPEADDAPPAVASEAEEPSDTGGAAAESVESGDAEESVARADTADRSDAAEAVAAENAPPPQAAPPPVVDEISNEPVVALRPETARRVRAAGGEGADADPQREPKAQADPVETRLAEAHGRFAAGDAEGTLRALREAMASTPGPGQRVRIHALEINALVTLGRLDEAGRVADRLGELDPAEAADWRSIIRRRRRARSVQPARVAPAVPPAESGPVEPRADGPEALPEEPPPQEPRGSTAPSGTPDASRAEPGTRAPVGEEALPALPAEMHVPRVARESDPASNAPPPEERAVPRPEREGERGAAAQEPPGGEEAFFERLLDNLLEPPATDDPFTPSTDPYDRD
jgi:hypothetical protein